MRYAIIHDGVVTNIAVSHRQLANNWVPIPVGMPVALGDAHEGGLFIAPDGRMRLTPEQEHVAQAEYERGIEDALKLIESGVTE